MELRTAFPAIARRFPHLEVATNHVDYRRLSIVYGVGALPVRLQRQPALR
jgi:cytochrome P450